MRPAVLYTLTATEILAGDYHQLIRANLRPTFTSNPNEAIAPMKVEAFAVPVHCVRRCGKPRAVPLRTDPWLQDYDDVFFAVEPALAEILEAPFEERARAAERKVQAAANLVQMANDAMARFNHQPWWKRGWAAIRYGVTY